MYNSYKTLVNACKILNILKLNGRTIEKGPRAQCRSQDKAVRKGSHYQLLILAHTHFSILLMHMLESDAHNTDTFNNHMLVYICITYSFTHTQKIIEVNFRFSAISCDQNTFYTMILKVYPINF